MTSGPLPIPSAKSNSRELQLGLFGERIKQPLKDDATLRAHLSEKWQDPEYIKEQPEQVVKSGQQ